MELKSLKSFKVKNVSNSRIASGAFGLANNESKTIKVILATDDLINDLQIFLDRELIEVYPKGEFEEVLDNTPSNVVQKESVKETGAINTFSTYDPDGASRQRMITVEEIGLDSSSTELGYTDADKDDARAFLSNHWKTVEKDLADIHSSRKIRMMMEVAVASGIGEDNKKYKLLVERLKELESKGR